ncbi:CG18745 [Drosophila busckii]|uniref:CG18745 n=1 Tax=Drosophila busckii TaxID=30019 RepID=A0A0M4EWN3_DROBS|nr:arrestin domain-containing protein 2 [Drosophila busckii]ALC47980.1 CG18745 [Drosophila busckii]
MGVTCVIEFDNNPHGTYFAGQVMTGKVTLRLDKVKIVKAVTLNISGFAETHWTESRRQNDKTSSDTFRGREDYVATQTYLLGSNESAQVNLEAGIHVYSFTCQLPVVCPSSIEGTYGRVRYMTKVALVRPWKFDQSYTRCFTVLKLMDLNYDSPILRVGAHCETQKIYCCWPCHSEPLKLELSVPQTGFVPGQTIPIGILAANDSHIRVEQLQISLVMLVTYYAQHLSRTHSRNERFVVSRLLGEAVPNHCKKQFNYGMRVPATPPTCFNLCRIVQIAYLLEVVAKVKGCHKDEQLGMPLTIGSIPLLGHMQELPLGPNRQPLNVQGFANPVNMPTAPSPDAPWEVDCNIPPPNYEEAVHMRSTNRAVDEFDGTAPPNTLSLDENGFTPLYAVFDVPSPTAPIDYTEGPLNNNNNNNNNNEPGKSDMNNSKGTWL